MFDMGETRRILGMQVTKEINKNVDFLCSLCFGRCIRLSGCQQLLLPDAKFIQSNTNEINVGLVKYSQISDNLHAG